MAERYANVYIAHIQDEMDAVTDPIDIVVDVVPPADLQVSGGDVWRARIDDELLKIINYDGNGQILTAERGIEGTTIATHQAERPIVHVVTAESLEAIINEQVETVNDASEIVYDNQASGLTAVDVQSAIDELKTIIDGM